MKQKLNIILSFLYGTRPLSRCYHEKMIFESLLNQFKSENSILDRKTYPDKEFHPSRARESLCDFGHVQKFYQIGKICSPAVQNEELYYYNTRV